MCFIPSFLPSYSDQVRLRVSFNSLSQFYGSWKPQAPAFIDSLFLFLFARAVTQWHITVVDEFPDNIQSSNLFSADQMLHQ